MKGLRPNSHKYSSCTFSSPTQLSSAQPPFPFPLPLLQFSSRETGAMAEESRAAELPPELRYIQYSHALEKKYLPSIRALISKDLSEPYSIYVYRYFLYQWGELCFMVFALPIPLSSKLIRLHRTKKSDRHSIRTKTP